MKPGRIKPIIKWAPVYPSGEIVLQHIGGTHVGVRRGLTDSAAQWRELKALGWRIVRVRIAQYHAKRSVTGKGD